MMGGVGVVWESGVGVVWEWCGMERGDDTGIFNSVYVTTTLIHYYYYY